MRKRIAALVLVVFILASVVAVAVAHDQEGVMEQQAAAFGAVAENAAGQSNAPNSFAPCIQGMAAGEFPCDKVDMLSYVPSSELGATFVNDIWGWTDPETGHDYALTGAAEGMVIVDITDPMRPVVVGTLPTHTSAGLDFWRDIKVYADHAFVVSENINHGMQVLDLTQVRDVSGPPVTFAETAYYPDPGDAHNIAINEETGYAYIVGSDTCSAGLHMVDISNPANPTFAGCFEDHGYTHDTQCVIYRGPDADYFGREICFSSNANSGFNTLGIADVTDKSNPVGIANVEYPNDGYSHQGWLTVDQKYFLHNDELDEFLVGINTTTRIFDVQDLDEPTLVNAVAHDTTSIGHNAYTEGRYMFASNYTAGLRVFETGDVAAGELPEVAYFDVYPENDNPSFEGGTWSNYPYFAQKGVVAVSSMDRGLFILQPRISRAGN